MKFTAIIIQVLFISSCITSCASNTVEAEVILKEYLHNRSAGQFEKCSRFLTDNFLNKFQQTYNTDYVDYYSNQNEDYYKNPKILETKRQDDKTIVIKASITVEGPGHKSIAFEHYYMIKEKGAWKIDDWKIEYK